jgi:antimicrobial peptide system SdpA family protein
MKATVIVGVVYAVVLSVAGLASVAAALPSNIVWGRGQLLGLRVELNKIAGQDFAFFTRSPETGEADVYRIEPDGSVGASLLVSPQATPANLLGISRTQRAQGPEVATLLREVPGKAWTDCGDVDRQTCLDRVKKQSKPLLRNTSPIPTVCGQVALSVENTTKWAYRWLAESPYTIERIAAATIDCVHGS